jgi:hypothetical protein
LSPLIRFNFLAAEFNGQKSCFLRFLQVKQKNYFWVNKSDLALSFAPPKYLQAIFELYLHPIFKPP